MNDQKLLDVIDQLTQATQAMQMAQTVQRSAYQLLVRHLARLKLAQPELLVADLRLMAGVQTDADWQSGHVQLASELSWVCGLP